MGISSISGGSSGFTPAQGADGSSDSQSSDAQDDLNDAETQIASGGASPLYGLKDWSSEGILARLTGTDGVLAGAAAIQQGGSPTGSGTDVNAAMDGMSDSGSPSAPSSSASSTTSAMASSVDY